MLASCLARNVAETICGTFFFSGFHIISCLIKIISFLVEVFWSLLRATPGAQTEFQVSSVEEDLAQKCGGTRNLELQKDM